MRFGVLGPLAVWTDDGRPVRVPEAKVRALLADLLAHHGQPRSADRLVDDLWPDTPPANPTGALHAKVSQLRRALDEAEPGARGLVVSGPAGYLIRADTDADRFATLTARARATSDPRARTALLADALALWRGPAFADVADHGFARSAIRRLDEERLVALEERAEARLAADEPAALTSELADLVERHPLRERLRAAHIRALYLAGRPGEALDSYHELRKRKAEELGLDPGAELTALHDAILRQDPALAPTRSRTNLPSPPTALIGRDAAVAEVRARLDAARLVTLTGPGGVGKTRLAIQVAAELTDAYPDGVWLVELAGQTAASVPEAVAAVLAVPDPPGEPADPVRRLAGALRGKRLLLVLDNCEHVVDAAATLAAGLLPAVPELRVLATSQEPLATDGEVVYAVPPLDAASAARLFATRAAAAAAEPAEPADQAAIAAVCRRLDGIPLALELAATRVRALGMPELLRRLDDRFRLLVAGRRDAPTRQRTLRATIDWSWHLLTPVEQAVLRRLAVHREGATLDAAEAVCAGGGVPADQVLDALARLVDRSLVVVADGPRYRLLESVAAYGLERLAEAGEADAVRARHRDYFVALAERAAPRLRGAEQRAWLRRLDAEAANLAAALDGAPAPLALRLVDALTWYWFLRGRLALARRSIAAALAAPGDAPPAARSRAITWLAAFDVLLGEGPDLVERAERALAGYADAADPAGRAHAEWFLSHALMGAGDLAAGWARVDRALATFQSVGDRWGEAAALASRAAQARPRGDLADARQDAERASALFRELGDRWGLLKAGSTLSALAEVAGDHAAAARLHRDALRMAEELGLRIEESYALSGLGRIALLTGDYARADVLHERARRLAAEHGHQRGEQFAEIGLGLSARRQGRLDAAEAHFRRWLDWCRRVHGEMGTALILAELGFVAELRGDAVTAQALHEEGLAAARTTDDVRAIALAQEGLAGAHALAGRRAQAVRLLRAAAQARASVGAPLPPAERGDVDRIAAALGIPYPP